MKVKLMQKICAISMSALMLVGTGVTGVGLFDSSSMTVYAASTEASEGSFEYSVNNDGTITITNYIGSDTDVVIPGVINGKKVTAIGKGAFWNSVVPTGVTIPNTVQKIEEEAFRGCENLTSIIIPNSVTMIENHAFSSTSLTAVTIPDSVTSIGDNAFRYCGKMKKAVIGDGVKTIGKGAFYDCSALTSLTLGNSIITIGENAFRNCYNLLNVTVPASTKEIGNYSFYYCYSLKSAYIENGTIGASAFSQCYKLASVTLGNGVKTIGNKAFNSCSALKKIRGNKGSYAQTFAKQNGYTFTAVEFTNKSTLSTDFLKLGRSVTINCSATMGTLPYTYAVYYKKAGTSDWTNLQGYKAVSTVKFTPSEAGSYEIRVNAKDKNDNVVRKDFKLSVMANTSKLGADEIKFGEKVKVRCFARGGSGTYQYAVYYKKSTSAHWSKLRGYGANNIIMLTPKAAVRYDVRVDVKDSSGNVVSKTLVLNVTK